MKTFLPANQPACLKQDFEVAKPIVAKLIARLNKLEAFKDWAKKIGRTDKVDPIQPVQSFCNLVATRMGRSVSDICEPTADVLYEMFEVVSQPGQRRAMAIYLNAALIGARARQPR